MVGIKFVVRRASEAAEIEDRTLYLRSRRTGEAGQEMRRRIRGYHHAVFEQFKQAGRAGRMTDRADLAEAGAEALERIDREQGEALEHAQEAAWAALEHAEQIALLALQENYGAAAKGLLDDLTDRELHAIVSTIEMGQMPADFFQSPGIPPKPSATGLSGPLPGSDSSGPGTAGRI